MIVTIAIIFLLKQRQRQIGITFEIMLFRKEPMPGSRTKPDLAIMLITKFENPNADAILDVAIGPPVP
ncbi:hypothetical protein AA0488_0083 [Kozakia baliensis NRIC 0488]|nr:hypothetical protein AA0488_0083 [Kozakia baliensis NRIC 0488]